jgi:hypothetical protein
VEPDVAVGEAVCGEAGVVGAVVMVVAEEEAVGKVGAAAG